MIQLPATQAKLYRELTKRGASKYGIPLSECHEKTVNGLMRRGLVTVWYGQVIPISREQVAS